MDLLISEAITWLLNKLAGRVSFGRSGLRVLGLLLAVGVSGSICGLAVGFAAFQLINERLAVMGFWAGFSVATFLVSWRAMAVWKLK